MHVPDTDVVVIYRAGRRHVRMRDASVIRVRRAPRILSDQSPPCVKAVREPAAGLPPDWP